MTRLLLAALSAAFVAVNGQAPAFIGVPGQGPAEGVRQPRPWQEFMKLGINTGLTGMNKGLKFGLAHTEGGTTAPPSEITNEFMTFGADSLQGFGNLAGGIPVGGAAAAGVPGVAGAAAGFGGAPGVGPVLWKSSEDGSTVQALQADPTVKAFPGDPTYPAFRYDAAVNTFPGDSPAAKVFPYDPAVKTFPSQPEVKAFPYDSAFYHYPGEQEVNALLVDPTVKAFPYDEATKVIPGDPAAFPPGTPKATAEEEPFIDNTAFLPKYNKAHFGSQQEFLNAAALTSINFGNLAKKHAALINGDTDDVPVSARRVVPNGASQPATTPPPSRWAA